MGFWQNRAEDAIRATAEALYPSNDFGAPDWKQTDMVARTFVWLGDLPAEKRRLLLLLFIAVELGAPLLTLGLRRFSRLTPLRRVEAVRRWRGSRFYLLRIIGDALKAAMNMMYMSHPAVLEHIGQYSHCDNAEDALRVAVRPDSLAEVSA